ncbi:MAG: hypothetical protein U1E49_16680 [Hyphomicrobiaceae bacterium]
MTDETTAAQRDVERARSDLGETIDALKHKMTTSELLNELRSQVFPDGGAQVMSRSMSTLSRQVQENPLALTLIGAGLAWMMFGRSAQSPGSSRQGDYRYGESSSGAYGGYRDAYPAASSESVYADVGVDADTSGRSYDAERDGSSTLGAMARSARERVHDTIDTVGGVAQSAAEGVSSTVSSAQDAFSSAASGVRHAAQDFGHTASDAMHATHRATRSAQQTAADLMERYPLAVGAVALAIGAAIGGALPTSRVEEHAVRGVVGDDEHPISGENRDMSQAYRGSMPAGTGATADVSGMMEDDTDNASSDDGLGEDRSSPPRSRWPEGNLS